MKMKRDDDPIRDSLARASGLFRGLESAATSSRDPGDRGRAARETLARLRAALDEALDELCAATGCAAQPSRAVAAPLAAPRTALRPLRSVRPAPRLRATSRGRARA
jgi:hypothetical protein